MGLNKHYFYRVVSEPFLARITSINDSVMPMPQSSRTNSTPTDCEDKRLAKLAQRYLDNPMLLHQLSDRVYELLYADIKIQKERIGNSSIGRQ